MLDGVDSQYNTRKEDGQETNLSLGKHEGQAKRKVKTRHACISNAYLSTTTQHTGTGAAL